MLIKEKILKPLLQTTNLQDYVLYLQEYLKSEQEKRLFYYDKISEQEKSEFINGEIICHSPVKRDHNLVVGNLYTLISTFVKVNKLGFVGVEKIMVKLTRNDFEPDICFFKKEKSKHFTKDEMFFPAPDFVVEVLSKSTEKRDRGVKMEDYAQHGVQEYWLINTTEKCVEQYKLDVEKQEFSLFKKVSSGTIKSFVIDKFTISLTAIFDEGAHLKALKKLI
jgi:Uma2 family endonuclease